MIPTAGYAAFSSDTELRGFAFARRDPGPRDVRIDILYCGICHSDIHTVRGEWGPVQYPFVPGHEIVGRVVEVGAEVSGFREGELVGVGCMVDSCRICRSCVDGLEQFCENGFTGTYSGIEKQTGRQTFGGYANSIVVDEHFVLRVPAALEAARAAPLLCAGITTYSPLRHWKIGKGHKVGIVGLGGLGHVGIKLAHALGAHVVLFTTSPGKRHDGLRLGADEVVVSQDARQMAQHTGSLDLILDTVAAPHDLDALIVLLKRDAVLVLVGIPAAPHPSPSVLNLVLGRRSLAGSITGGLAETQEMLDFCAQHGLGADIELIPIQAVNEAYERLLNKSAKPVKYRFVIDMSSLAGVEAS
jgi:alcohol dehydrogenase (NADP+)